MKPSALITAFILAFCLSPYAMAKKGDECGGDSKHHYGSLKKMKEKLNLTDEQKKTLDEKQAKFGKEAMKKKHAEMEKAEKDLRQAIEGDVTEEKVREKFETLQKLQEDFARTRFEKILLIRSILTPEQRAKFREANGKE